MTHVILYIDGSSRPNPGHSGWGAHGYSYSSVRKVPRRIETFYLTDKGYVAKDEAKELTYVEPIEFYDFCVYEPETDTNNAAELYALYRTLAYFKDRAIESLTLYTDSTYVVKGLNEYMNAWRERGWKKHDGSDIAHAPIWQAIDALQAYYQQNAKTLSIHWVKGHAQSYGNILADRLAVIASTSVHHPEALARYDVTDALTYLNKEPTRHPFFYAKRAYFSSASRDDNARYYLATPESDEDFGRKSAKASFTIVQRKEPDPILEAVKTRYRSVHTQLQHSAMIRLDRLYHRGIYPYLERYGASCLITSQSRYPSLEFIDGRAIASGLIPPGLSYRAFEVFAHLDSLLNAYLTDTLDDTYTCYDITHHFFQDGVLHKQLTSSTSYLEIPLTHADLTYRLVLQLGSDLPSRNALKHCEGRNPSVKVMLWQDTEISHRYVCVVSMDDAVSLWSSYYRNQLFKERHT